MGNKMEQRLVTVYEVVQMLKINRKELYLLVKKNKFPKPIIISTRKWRWRITDIDIWVKNL